MQNISDDLDFESGDDEIDVCSNSDYSGSNMMMNNGNNSNDMMSPTSSSAAALSGMNNDHNFGGVLGNGTSLYHHQQEGGLDGSQDPERQAAMNNDAARKRAHHNALERKRRDHIKDSFHTLRDAIPNIKGEKTSRAQILKAATDYIKLMRNRNSDYQQDIDSLKKQNNEIEIQIKQLERVRTASNQYIKQQPLEISTKKMEADSSSCPTTFEHDEEKLLNANEIKKESISIANAYPSSTSTTGNNQTTTTTIINASGISSTPTSTSNVVLVTKPLSSTTITTIQSQQQSKKFRTIINPKSNLNVINVNTTNEADNDYLS